MRRAMDDIISDESRTLQTDFANVLKATAVREREAANQGKKMPVEDGGCGQKKRFDKLPTFVRVLTLTKSSWPASLRQSKVSRVWFVLLGLLKHNTTNVSVEHAMTLGFEILGCRCNERTTSTRGFTPRKRRMQAAPPREFCLCTGTILM